MHNSVLCYLEETVRKHGNKIAVEDADSSVTFIQMQSQAKAIGIEMLRRQSRQKRCPVFIYLPKSTASVISFLGSLYAGHFYVPSDVKSPVERTQKILDTLNPLFVITNRIFLNTVRAMGVPEDKILIFEDIQAVENITLDFAEVIDTDPVYAMFTSGSTGTPKGVVIPHRGILDYIDWAIEEFSINEDIIIGNQAPLFFDNSSLDLYLCFACGAKLVLIPESLFTFPSKLIKFLEDKNINFIFWVPSAMVHVANLKVLQSHHTVLKLILFCGEVMPVKPLNYWRKNIPDAVYANLYGPTEITDACSYYKVDREFDVSESLPIGIACKNTHILILTEQNTEAKTDEIGELCVRGSSLAHGYWNDPDKTASAFVQNPLNPHYPEKIYRTGDLAKVNKRGEILYVGRKDHQIKHLGYRIELGEIETAAIGNSAFDLTGVCTVYNQQLNEIALFYTAAEKIDEFTLRKELLKTLPKYMVPTKYVMLNEFPLNINGKINRLILADMLEEF